MSASASVIRVDNDEIYPLSAFSSPSSDVVPAFRVTLYLYDLTHGMAKAFSPAFLGKQIDGIWHTGLVVYGYEYFFGGGIQAMAPETTMAGTPIQKIELGATQLPQADFHDWLCGVSHRFTPQTYDLFTHNCNDFSNEASRFLTGRPIPSFITGLPEEALNTPLGQQLKPMLNNFMNGMRQQNGQHMAGFVPWGEEKLELPPPNAKHDCYLKQTLTKSAAPAAAASSSSSSAAAAAGPAAVIAAIAAAAAAAAASSASSSSSSSSLGNSSSGSLPAEYSSHGHASLNISGSLTRTYWLSRDSKENTFVALIKASSVKVDKSAGLSEDDKKLLDSFVFFAASSSSSSFPFPSLFQLLTRLVCNWPPSALFGVLGLFRLCLLRTPFSSLLNSSNTKDEIIRKIISLARLDDDKKEIPNSARLMAFCSLSNLFAAPELHSLLSSAVFAAPLSTLSLTVLQSQSSKPELRLLASTLLFNTVICRRAAARSGSDGEVDEVLMDDVAPLWEQLSKETDAELAYRLSLTLFQIVFANSGLALVFVSMEPELKSLEKKFGKKEEEKVRKVLEDLNVLVQFERKNME